MSINSMIKVGKMIRRYFRGILDAIKLKVNNSMLEAKNSKIEKIKKMACGFRNRKRFKNAILFHPGGLDIMPVSTLKSQNIYPPNLKTIFSNSRLSFINIDFFYYYIDKNQSRERIVVFTMVIFATICIYLISGVLMFRDRITILLQFVKKIFYEHDISGLNLEMNNTQTNILMFIIENSEKSMSEISLMTGLKKSSFTRSVDYLVENGFITRNPPEKDRRKIKLSLTDKGVKATNLIRDDFDAYLEKLISDFSIEEKTDFFESLASVSKYMNKILERKKR